MTNMGYKRWSLQPEKYDTAGVNLQSLDENPLSVQGTSGAMTYVAKKISVPQEFVFHLMKAMFSVIMRY